MPDQFCIKIQPVTANTAVAVGEVLQRFLGVGSETRTHELTQSEGFVLERLERAAAEDIADQLRGAGASVEVLRMGESAHVLFRLRLVSIGGNKVQVIKEVREITGLGLRESKELVENLGVVKEHLGHLAAEEFKEGLEALGAKVAVEPVGGLDPEQEFVVYGRVIRPDGLPAFGVLVRAFDRDLRTEQPLGGLPAGSPSNSLPGSFTDSEGSYKISYTRSQFHRAEKNRADLLLRVYNEVRVPLKADPAAIVYNARPEEKVDLQIKEGEPVVASEHERLLAFLEPVMEGVEPEGLSADEITFLCHETEIGAFEEEFPAGDDSITYLARGALLARDTGIPAEPFYGWAREGLGIVRGDDRGELDLEALLRQNDETLREALGASIKKNVIPTRVRERFDGIFQRLRELRGDYSLLPRYELNGRVLDAETGEPLVGFTVRASRTAEESRRITAFTDRQGAFDITYLAERESTEDVDSTLVLEVLAPDQETVARREVPTGQTEPVTLEVELPEPPAPVAPGADIALEDVDGELAGLLSNGLRDVLVDRGAASLADVRGLVGRGQIDDLAEEFGEQTVRTLKAHAELSLLASDAGVRSGLIAKDYRSPVQIADVPLERFVGDTRDTLGEDKALELGHLARAGVSYFDSVLTGIALERDRAALPEHVFPGIAPDLVADLLPLPRCSCDCNHALSPSAYLADLLDYVTTHLDLEGPDRLTLQFLHERFHQPFDRLPASCRYQQEQVRQVRICVEVLRGYLRAHRPSTEALQRLKDHEGDYCFEVYQRLLERLGVTFDEVRRALIDGNERDSLAGRLGIADSHLLNGDLYFEPGEVSEADLERLFGYRRTTDPLREAQDPRLLEWQYARMRERWVEQDHPADEVRTPLVDPDLVDMQELATGSNLYPLLDDRKQFVASSLSAVRSRARSLDGLDEILRQDLLTARDELGTKHAQADAGVDVSDYLEERGLNMAAFRYLHGLIGTLEGGQQPVESEWANVHAIVVQAKKARKHEEWKRQEFSSEVTISPDFFEARRRDFTGSLDEDPSLRWRIELRRRRDWERLLRTRIQQKQALADGLHQAVGAVEELLLPVLRDALVEASNASGTTLEDKGEWITKQLQIDARTDGCRITTRISQAIVTIQNLVFSVRTGQLDPSVAEFEPLPESFDQDWQWMGAYATWKAATAVYLYPENVLHPNLRTRRTPGFAGLIDEVRQMPRLTPDAARAAAQRYGHYFMDVCSLYIEAACWMQTGRQSPVTSDLPPYKRMLLFFARAGSGRRYWSAFDPAAENFDYAQTYWRELPDISEEIIGASFYVEPQGDGVVCLFFRSHDALSRSDKLGFRRYKVTDFGDSERLISLETPGGATNISAVVVQQQSSRVPPRIIVHDKDKNELYHRALNRAATGWAEAGWHLLYSRETVTVDASYSVTVTQGGGRERLGRGQGTVRIPFDIHQIEVPYYLTVGLSPQDHIEGIAVAAVSTGASPDAPVNIILHANSRLTVLNFFIASPTRRIIVLTKDMVPQDQLDYNERQVFEDMDHEIGLINVGGSPIHVGLVTDIPITRQGGFVGATRENVYWWEQSGGSTFDCFRHEWNSGRRGEAPAGLVRIPPVDGAQDQDPLIYQRNLGGGPGLYVGQFVREEVDRLITLTPVQIDHFDITDLQETALESEDRRSAIARVYFYNLASREAQRIPWSNLDYLAEAYYFVPVFLGQQLQQEGLFAAALDWYRTVFDYAAASNQRKVFDPALLERGAASSEELGRADDWFRDPLNPHSIGRTRRNVYLRFTLLSVIQCLVEYADEEFTNDTGESLARARTLYVTALELLDTETLRQDKPRCDELIIEILNEVDHRDLREIYERLVDPLVRWGSRERAERAAQAIVRTHNTNASSSPAAKVEAVRGLVSEAQANSGVSVYAEILEEQTALRRRSTASLSTLPVLAGSLSRLTGAGLSVADVRKLHTPYVPKANHAFCIPPNPVVKALRQHISVSLWKLRTCRNIAGLRRQIEAYAVPTDVEGSLPRTAADGTLVLPDTTPLRPTPYRYRVLVDRVKELTNLAGQVESSYLSALQGLDAALYQELQAEQDIELAWSGVRLQDLRVNQAEEQVSLAELQQDRAEIQFDHYDDLIDRGLIGSEKAALRFMEVATGLQAAAAVHHGLAGGFKAIFLKFGGSSEEVAQTLSSLASAASSTASIFSTRASFERREEEWKFARRLARQDVRIGAQQVRIAEGGVEVVEQERDVAELRAGHAQATADFLANKNLNAELYDWMTAVLRGVYAFFLQQATATARLAEHQLAFERQEPLPGFIRSDYWKATSAAATLEQDRGEEDRLGLTGSARLLQDVYRLDQYAFETDQRKLQLSRTFSLARLDPVAFQHFRETGVLVFETAMGMFDEEFPGHYLRLIKRVRTSVVALIPPVRGIRATLTSAGISRVVVKNGIGTFQTNVIRRDPERIAFTSPQDATGLFELNPQPEMLNPFEGSGVDTHWELRMPRAANPFDYDSIADVLVTVEYTALHSYDHERQVLKERDRFAAGDRAFSFRQEFADAWYDLHNPDLMATPMKVTFETRREDFPPHLAELRISQLVLYFALADDMPLEDFDVGLHVTTTGAGGVARPIDGIISTRRGNANAWFDLLTNEPVGQWELSLPDEANVRQLFTEERVEDILLVVTYEGVTPAWPA